uniref:Piezo non-specific cation channel cap domain-containing protein n=1 Tax=Populus trichocarpa TaxID=3694 RepID=A0A2K2BM93_POPTR
MDSVSADLVINRADFNWWSFHDINSSDIRGCGAICEDINDARAEGELGVEEVLYWTLIKIYRSPHMLLEDTKPDEH